MRGNKKKHTHIDKHRQKKKRQNAAWSHITLLLSYFILLFYHDFQIELHNSTIPNMVSWMALLAMQVIGPFYDPHHWIWTASNYLQAERWILGMWTNTIEKGVTVIGSDVSTFIGSKGGLSPVEFTIKALPFSSIVWLCRSPFIAVKWYSSLLIAIVFLGLCIQSGFFLGCRRCFETLLMAESVVTWTWTVVLLSRLINNNVIPSCNNCKQHLQIWIFKHNTCESRMSLLTDRFAQCAYARMFFVPVKFVDRTFLPINRCQSRALQPWSRISVTYPLFHLVSLLFIIC